MGRPCCLLHHEAEEDEGAATLKPKSFLKFMPAAQAALHANATEVQNLKLHIRALRACGALALNARRRNSKEGRGSQPPPAAEAISEPESKPTTSPSATTMVAVAMRPDTGQEVQASEPVGRGAWPGGRVASGAQDGSVPEFVALA
mmetsp:Transcript_9482/g.33577  ORF Transcript_9482/g.33577 Transcript_9482/m.33577 type:complete len:146 (-) Transcript_9482:175-612(-)